MITLTLGGRMKKASAIIIVCLIIGCASQHSSTATNTLSQTHPEQSKEDASQIKQQKVFYNNIDDAFNAMTHHLDKLSDDAVKSAFDLAVAELKKDPAHVRANIVLFKAHLYKANEDQVVEQFKKLIILTPKVSEECIELGTIFAQLGKISHAIRQFQASVDINPSFIPGYYNLGRAYFMKRHYEESIKAYEKTIELAPKHYRAWNNLGWIYMAKKDFKKATDMISNALEIKPDYAVAYMNLGTINLLQKKWMTLRKNSSIILNSNRMILKDIAIWHQFINKDSKWTKPSTPYASF
ncbi:MAG: TPR repeat-containing protein [Candidatus Magnetoglobus multicellularis str. Araruama]|uniref:TPR repeat-containing protein n=1 Tax=Candidatus Magnetoglobus multicellularis str. Araruama TaxID=890399 RepID=A0A1V1PCJ5_9BACT|nr:MAG: TPR repeat-containing protein [Candidatus Magnetoglobus multicellularis str. Araruama]